MTKEEIQKWQEEMFIYSCYMYDLCEDTVLKDVDYDSHCQYLLRWYDEATPEFKARVSKSRLSTGTSMGMTYTDDEKREAREWYLRVKGKPLEERPW